MDGPQPQKSTVDLDLGRDYISNLPADAKEIVLLKLALKEAVRTSILSSKWRCTWSSIPKLLDGSGAYNPSSATQTLWEVQNTEYNLFKCLEVVDIDLGMGAGFENPEQALRVAKFVLSTAPVLEKFAMYVGELEEFAMDVLEEELMRFPILSKKAEVSIV